MICCSAPGKEDRLLAARLAGVPLNHFRVYYIGLLRRNHILDLNPNKLGPTPAFQIKTPPTRDTGIFPEFCFRYKAIQLLEYAMRVYPGDIDRSDGFPTGSWYIRAARLVNAHNATLEYSWIGIRAIIRDAKYGKRKFIGYWWYDKLISVQEFRNHVFYPLLRDILNKTHRFHELKEEYKKGTNIMIASEGSRPFRDLRKHFLSSRQMGSAALICAAVLDFEAPRIKHKPIVLKPLRALKFPPAKPFKPDECGDSDQSTDSDESGESDG